MESTWETVDTGPVDVDPVDDHQHSEEDQDEDEYVYASETDDSHFLLIMLDCETTGFSISQTLQSFSCTCTPIYLHQSCAHIQQYPCHPKNK